MTFVAVNESSTVLTQVASGFSVVSPNQQKVSPESGAGGPVPSTEQDLSSASLPSLNRFISRPIAQLGAAFIIAITASEHSYAAAAAREGAFPTTPAARGEPFVRTDTPATAFYQVHQGDTVSGIAKRFKISQNDISEANPGLDVSRLRIGQSLKLPHIRKGFHIVTSGETPAKIAKLYSVTLEDLQRANPDLQSTKLKIGQALAVPARDAVKKREAGDSVQKLGGHLEPPLKLTQAVSQQSSSQVARPPTASLPLQQPPQPALRVQQAPSSHVVNGRISQAIEQSPGFFMSLLKALGYEGGLSRDKSDAAHQHGVPVTNMGITGVAMKQYIADTENRQASNAELIQRIEALKMEEAVKIYAHGFWRKEYQTVGSKLAFLLFDWGVTSHPKTVIKQFQSALQVPVTGELDAPTLSRISSLGEQRAAETLTACRKGFYSEIVRRRPADASHLAGWHRRADAALQFTRSSGFVDLEGVFKRTASRGVCDLFDPVREGAVVLRKASHETALVLLLQERLSEAGWTMKKDGKFGPEMERVVADFKGRYNLPGANAEWAAAETKVLDALLQSLGKRRA